jgi:hypothetical protein
MSDLIADASSNANSGARGNDRRASNRGFVFHLPIDVVFPMFFC